MKHKTLTIIFGMIFLIGIAAAGNTLSNLQGIDIPPNVVAGNTFQANFSFDYLADGVNEDDSPFIIKLNFSSEDQETYPVWKGDFEINGFIEKKSFFGFWTKTTYFNCSETAPLLINHSIGSEEISEIPDGIFYCFSESNDLKLNEKDIVYLDILSHPALWPGKYTLTAELYYLTDTYPPILNILNKSYFDQYFSDGSHVSFEVEIIDVNLEDWNAKIITPNRNISFAKEKVSGNIYRFFQTLPTTNPIPEGYYEILVTAEDSNGLVGTDNTTLRIDRTPPQIELIGPTGIVSEEFTIKFNVTDGKAGVDNESVQVRLREIVNGQICPETGGVIGEGNFSCITTPWINLTLVDDLFEVDINTTKLNLTSGEYWLDARAEDILGNKAEWIA